jgi:hypothetical protein
MKMRELQNKFARAEVPVEFCLTVIAGETLSEHVASLPDQRQLKDTLNAKAWRQITDPQ